MHDGLCDKRERHSVKCCQSTLESIAETGRYKMHQGCGRKEKLTEACQTSQDFKY